MKYFTKEKKRVEFMKNFLEDEPVEPEDKRLPYKTQKYSKYLKLRHEIEKINAVEFVEEQKYKD